MSTLKHPDRFWGPPN